MQPLPLMVTSSVSNRQGTWGNLLAPGLIAVPLACFAINVLMWLVYGVDIPFMDDWRAYQSGGAGSFDLTYLFKPSNDTLYPVGIFLDSVAQRVLRGNSVAYQLISLVAVLGSLLLLQWRLLRSVLENRMLAAAAFSATLFMLQPDSYWGMQDMAYHQAVPVVAVLWSLYLVTVARWTRFTPMLLLAIGLMAGMTYISGAFAMLATGVALIVAAGVLRDRIDLPLMRGGVWLTMGGIATSIPQLWVIVVHQKGTHRADAPMAYPTEADFWLYLLGKVGRSLMLPMEKPALSLALVALACAALVCALIWAMRVARGNPAGNLSDAGGTATSEKRLFVVLLSLGAVVAVYLAIVAAGRTNLRPAGMAPLDIFVTGFHRFHFFWATLLWPWLIATVILAAQRWSQRAAAASATVAALAIISLCTASGVFRHARFYEAATDMRINGIKCIHAHMEEAQPIVCHSLLPTELTVALKNAERIDASFSRALEFTRVRELPVSAGSNTALPLGSGDVLSGRFVSSASGSLTSVGILVGTYAGRSDGTVSLQVCSQSACSQGAIGTEGAADNDFITVDLRSPLSVAAGDPLTYSLSVTGGTHPVAAWLYGSVDGSAETAAVRRGDSITPLPGQATRLRLSYVAYRDDDISAP